MELHVGDKIELTEEASSYTTLPKGLRGTVTAISGPHATMNGGGFDVTFTIDDFALAGEISGAVTSRLRELQAKDPGFYTDRYIAYKALHVTAHSDRMSVVRGESL